jgi:hypothetical protein
MAEYTSGGRASRAVYRTRSIGMGDSEKLEGSDPARYGFLEQRRYLET